jgi:hypothetical protein
MMSMLEILGLLVVVCGGWFFGDSLKVREAANAAMRRACKTEGLLFLDDPVALESIWAVRDDEGRLRLRRVYRFEYSDTGNYRHQATVTLVDDRVSVSTLPVGAPAVPEGTTWQ